MGRARAQLAVRAVRLVVFDAVSAYGLSPCLWSPSFPNSFGLKGIHGGVCVCVCAVGLGLSPPDGRLPPCAKLLANFAILPELSWGREHWRVAGWW